MYIVVNFSPNLSVLVGYCSPAAESVKAMLDYCSSPDTLLLELLLFQYQYRIIPILRILKKEFSGSSALTWEWGKGGSLKAGLALRQRREEGMEAQLVYELEE